MSIEKLYNPDSAFQDQLKRAKELMPKWEKTGLLKGKDLQEKYAKENMVLMLENQAKQLFVEQTQTGTGGTFTVGSGEQWAGVALPLVRKVFADIPSKEFVSLQPMPLPTGLVFYLEFKYGTNQPTLSGNSRFNSSDSLYGTTTTKNVPAFGGLYGAGRWGFSINEYTASISFTTTTASAADINFNGNYSASAQAGFLRKLSVTAAAAAVPGMDTVGARSFVLTGSGVSESNLFAEFSSYNTTTDTLTFIVSGTAGQLGLGSGSATIYYSKQPTDNARGDFEDTATRGLTGSNSIPEFNMEFRSEAVAAKTRKVKGKWTSEGAQDINAYQSIDVEAEITSVLSEYISMEIDLEILDMIEASVNTYEIWSCVSNVFYNKNTATWSQAAAGAGGYYNTQGEWFKTLGTKMQTVSRQILKKTVRGQANKVMISPEVSVILESISGYAASTDGKSDKYAMGAYKAGNIANKWDVIINPYMTSNTILMGYKGGSFLECGASYLTYVPLVMTPTLFDPETFTPRKGLSTRYAKKVTRPEFFGAVHVADLDKL